MCERGCGCTHGCWGGFCSHFTPPRGRSTLGRGAVPGRQWGAGQGCRAWGVGGFDEVQGEALSTPLLHPLAQINIHGWAELGRVAKKGKAGGMGCGRKGIMGSFLKGDSSRDVPSEGTALEPSAQRSGPIPGQTHPSHGPQCSQSLRLFFPEPFTNILQKSH